MIIITAIEFRRKWIAAARPEEIRNNSELISRIHFRECPLNLHSHPPRVIFLNPASHPRNHNPVPQRFAQLSRKKPSPTPSVNNLYSVRKNRSYADSVYPRRGPSITRVHKRSGSSSRKPRGCAKPGAAKKRGAANKSGANKSNLRRKLQRPRP